MIDTEDEDLTRLDRIGYDDPNIPSDEAPTFVKPPPSNFPPLSLGMSPPEPQTFLKDGIPFSNPKRTKEEFLANPPKEFCYVMSVGTMHMTLIGQNDDLIQYYGVLYQEGELNPAFGYVVYVFKRICSRLKGFVQAYNLETNEQIITDYSGFRDKVVRRMKCNWALCAFEQFGFTPYEDTV